MDYRQRRLQPQPILLPELESGPRDAFPTTFVSVRSQSASYSQCQVCLFAVEVGACFCGYCGLRLRASQSY